MLLFSVVAGAMVLRPLAFVLANALLLPVLWLAMAPQYEGDPVGLAVQVAVHAAVLIITALAVFFLRRRAEELLARTWELSRTDELTGLPNRRQLTERAPALVARAQRDGHMLAVVVLDVDRFKQVNDDHGHTVGDDVLRAVGAAVRAEVRADELAARTGGEEVVVVACVPDAAEATRLARRLQDGRARQRRAGRGDLLARPRRRPPARGRRPGELAVAPGRRGRRRDVPGQARGARPPRRGRRRVLTRSSTARALTDLLTHRQSIGHPPGTGISINDKAAGDGSRSGRTWGRAASGGSRGCSPWRSGSRRR